jgi:Acetyltransferase (GNAT) domain
MRDYSSSHYSDMAKEYYIASVRNDELIEDLTKTIVVHSGVNSIVFEDGCTYSRDHQDKTKEVVYLLPSRMRVIGSPAKRTEKNFYRNLQETIAIRSGKLWFRDYLETNSLSFLGKFLLRDGYIIKPTFLQIIDLKKSLDTIYADFRGSYKGCIKWGGDNIKMEAYSSNNIQPEIFDLIIGLHRKAAGRQTRSSYSWELQYKMIVEGGCFLVTSEYCGEVIGAGLFLLDQKNCTYWVGAYDRSFSDKPITHSIIWRAIQMAKELGCASFELGEISGDLFSIDSEDFKKKNISNFKQGFGGDLLPVMDFFNK